MFEPDSGAFECTSHRTEAEVTTKARTQRLDERVMHAGLCADVREAAGLIMAGKVMVGEKKIDKPGAIVPLDAPVRLIGGPPMPFVSRGGIKLDGALRHLGLDVRGLRCADVGASTGGFTDCLLQRGAEHVVAIDVGHGLLADKLRRDPRVTPLERTHARSLTPQNLPWLADLLVMDVSFIGARAILPVLGSLVRPGGRLLVLVKPQFELPAHMVPAGGVVADDGARWQAVKSVQDSARDLGLKLLATAESELSGPMGNREVFLLLERPDAEACPEDDRR
jgi:23S rRNA (cytidine1920-2'-O)/16S rRNA (cytidine1409-2'-O)-methyltransferase